MSKEKLEITMNIERLLCLTNEFTSIIDSGLYTSAKIVITESMIIILPLAAPIEIVLTKRD